jgi:hypothetical protein
MQKKRKEPPFTVVNGRKRYSIRCEVMGEFRPASQPGPGTQGKPPVQPQNAQNEAGQGGEGAAGSGTDTNNDDVVRIPIRVLSSVFTWSGTFFGPILVNNGHNDSYALRRVVTAINNRTGNRAVPMVWDHSLDARAICGRLTSAAWEDSTDIPTGTNAIAEFPRSVDPQAAALAEAGMIPATSIWWQPDMEMSHPEMDFDEFWDRQGEIVDGQQVCWLPVDLQDAGVIHHALVWAGADPFSGPRDEGPTNQAAQAVRNTQAEQGGRGMEIEKALALITIMCQAVGIDVVLSAGAPIPDTLEKRFTDSAGTLRSTQGQYNDLALKLQTVGTSLLKEGESAISSAEVLNRLPARLEAAKLGDAFLAHQQKAAVTAYDAANVDPKNPQSLTDAQKLLRQSIENSRDLNFLEASIAENTRLAKERFGTGGTSNRTSQGDELPPGQNPAVSQSTEQILNAARMDRFMPRKVEGGKE